MEEKNNNIIQNLDNKTNKNIPSKENVDNYKCFVSESTEFPQNFPQQNDNFVPAFPQKRYHSMLLSTQHLTKRIYLEMQRTIKNYDELENIAPQEDKNTINNLKDQMEILSIAILNIYKTNYPKSRLPIFNTFRIRLSDDYKTALNQMYNRVYHILELANKLLLKTNNANQRSTLIIVVANLKSQLNTLNNLK
ncbi:MAG: hypothetical protein IKR12_02775 [Clostridia bacterium]|nr:hypothetical protein [Clostridia bacterium]